MSTSSTHDEVTADDEPVAVTSTVGPSTTVARTQRGLSSSRRGRSRRPRTGHGRRTPWPVALLWLAPALALIVGVVLFPAYALARGGITTLEQAAAWRDDELLSLPQCGPAAVAKLRALVACHTPSCTPSDPEISPCA